MAISGDFGAAAGNGASFSGAPAGVFAGAAAAGRGLNASVTDIPHQPQEKVQPEARRDVSPLAVVADIFLNRDNNPILTPGAPNVSAARAAFNLSAPPVPPPAGQRAAPKPDPQPAPRVNAYQPLVPTANPDAIARQAAEALNNAKTAKTGPAAAPSMAGTAVRDFGRVAPVLAKMAGPAGPVIEVAGLVARSLSAFAAPSSGSDTPVYSSYGGSARAAFGYHSAPAPDGVFAQPDAPRPTAGLLSAATLVGGSLRDDMSRGMVVTGRQLDVLQKTSATIGRAADKGVRVGLGEALEIAAANQAKSLQSNGYGGVTARQFGRGLGLG